MCYRYWDVHAGRQYSYATGWCAADLKWKTNTCILGFNVMGIWPKYADGTDINSIDVSRDRTLVDKTTCYFMVIPAVGCDGGRFW